VDGSSGVMENLSAIDEFESTMQLLYRRSALSNGSLVLAVFAIVASALFLG
jgi:hypothetical protein